MLTDKELKEITAIGPLLKSPDREARKLGKTLLLKYQNFDNLYIQFCASRNLDGITPSHIVKTSRFRSIEKYIIILNNLSKENGHIYCKNGDKLIFPVLQPFRR